MSNSIKTWKILLSGFGAGWLPVAPGTWGAAVAILMVWPLVALPTIWITPVLMVLILIFLWIGVKGSNVVQGEWGDDPKQTVIDEMIGVWITILSMPLTWPWLLGGFVLFRFFDIAKPLGIRQLESIKGGWGIMLDDVLAGVYANLVLQVIFLVIHA
jgi:phosphatidylglycerophosphatase A